MIHQGLVGHPLDHWDMVHGDIWMSLVCSGSCLISHIGFALILFNAGNNVQLEHLEFIN